MVHYVIQSTILVLLYKNYYDNIDYTIKEIISEHCFDKENKDHLVSDIKILKDIGLLHYIPEKVILGNDENNVNLDTRTRISTKGINDIIRTIKSDFETKNSILALGNDRINETVANLEKETSR